MTYLPPRRPVLVLPDAEVLLRDWLRQALTGRSLPGGVPLVLHDVALALPDDWVARDPRKHFVAVAQDATSVTHRGLRGVATLRGTCWGPTTTEAKALARLCFGLLLAHPGGNGIGAVRPGIGPAPASDPNNGADLASFTVLAQLRGT